MDKSKLSKQVTANVGLYFVCYELSKRGWNVLPTSRNTKGVDIVIFNQDSTRKLTIQVKTLTKESPIPLGKDLNNLVADFVMVCVLAAPIPRVFIIRPKEITQLPEIVRQQPQGSEKGFWAINSPKLWKDFSKR
jgi:hypothetical protein